MIELLATYGDAADLETAKREAAEIIANDKRQKAAEYQRNRRRNAGAKPREVKPPPPLLARAQSLGLSTRDLAEAVGVTMRSVQLADTSARVPRVAAAIEAHLAALEGAP